MPYEYTDENWNSSYPLARVSADGTVTAELLKTMLPIEEWNLNDKMVAPLADGNFMLFTVTRNGYQGNYFLKAASYDAQGNMTSPEGGVEIDQATVAPSFCDAVNNDMGQIVLMYSWPKDYTVTWFKAAAVNTDATVAWNKPFLSGTGLSQFTVATAGKAFYTYFTEAPDNTTVGIKGMRAYLDGSFTQVESPYDIDITLTEPGTLESKLPASMEGMLTMRVAGPMNGTDVKVIRDKVAKTTVPLVGEQGYIVDFDFKDATIVEGGDVYYSYYDTDEWQDVDVKTENDVFPAFFFSGYSVENLVFPESITAIGRDALYDCAKLDVIEIPESVTKIGYEAFAGTAITEITLPAGLTEPGAYMLYCTNLQSLTLPESITKLPEGFVQATFLKEIDLGDRVTEIGLNAFKDCAYLEKVTGYSAVDNIRNYAFYNCFALTEVPVSEKLTSIGTEAFANCGTLTTVSLPATLTWLGSRAFGNCPAMKTINVDKANTEYQSIDGILYNKAGSTLISCPGGREDAVEVPEGVTLIDKCGFEACVSLKEVSLPASVTEVGNEAFKFCMSLEKLSCMATVPPTLGWDDPFYEVPVETCELTVPQESLEAYKAAEGWKDFVKMLSYTGINGIEAESNATWYSLDGTRLGARPESEGVYILVCKGKPARKVIVRR